MERKNHGSRDRNILAMVRGLLLSEIAFQEISKKYKEGQLRFSDIGNWVDDKGQSLLYDLKENVTPFFDRRKGALLIKTSGSSIWLSGPSFMKL